jgi:Ribbon-helix-helix protein, copG family
VAPGAVHGLEGNLPGRDCLLTSIHSDYVTSTPARLRSPDDEENTLLRFILSITMSQTTPRRSKVLAVSVPPEIAEEFERIARANGRNKSELFREMLRVYAEHQRVAAFESLQRYGAARARRLGIRDEDDVERLIEEYRHG